MGDDSNVSTWNEWSIEERPWFKPGDRVRVAHTAPDLHGETGTVVDLRIWRRDGEREYEVDFDDYGPSGVLFLESWLEPEEYE